MYRALPSQSVFWCCSLQSAAPHPPPTSAKSEYWMRLVAYCLLTHIAVSYSLGCKRFRTLVGNIFLLAKTNSPNAKGQVNRLVFYYHISSQNVCAYPELRSHIETAAQYVTAEEAEEKTMWRFNAAQSSRWPWSWRSWRHAKDHAPAKYRTPTRRTAVSAPPQTPQEALPVLLFKLPVWNTAQTGKMCNTDSARSS